MKAMKEEEIKVEIIDNSISKNFKIFADINKCYSIEQIVKNLGGG